MNDSTELEVRTWSSPDVDIWSWTPDDLTQVYFLLELEIGAVGDDRKDLYQIVVATPEGLRSHARGKVIAERATLVVSEYSWAEVQRAILAIVRRCACQSLNESVMRLQRFFEWEYEDYAPDA